MRYSLSHRLVFAAVILLASFLTVAGFALNRLYQDRAMESLQTQLLGHVYTLLSAAYEDDTGMIQLAELVPDPRLNQTDSGLFATIRGHRVAYSWTSASMLGQQLDLHRQTAPGDIVYRQTDGLLILNFGFAWDDIAGESWDYTISIASTLETFRQDMQRFQQGVIYWLGGSALLLLLVQVAVLRWGLQPLNRAADDIKRIESGQLQMLHGKYPEELLGLTENINSLIRHAEANQQRYRNSLGDLAHSLKTPLAMLQAVREKQDSQALEQTLDEQLPHIDSLVQYYLQRASVMGKSTLAQAIVLAPVVEKIVRGLDKVYLEKQVMTELQISGDVVFHGDMADLMELLGNLLDNAYKYGNGHVIVTARKDPGLLISVEDNGPGIDENDTESLIRRGIRADQRIPGQGIGLDIVNDIVSLYNARLSIGKSRLGGALFIIEF